MSLEEWLAIGVPDEVADEAMQWIAKLDSEGFDLEQQEAFQAWLSADATHLWAFEELSEFWAKTSFLEAGSHNELQTFPANQSTDDTVAEFESVRYSKVASAALWLVFLGFVFAMLNS
ncbi:FecR/PupR family sigma factor regulator [Thalassotalea mangrovi]|uniref:DUF4880 domain-containing protein n=1 Tax=Thalassotalea mangrovi TaxID=2572245 RepID=A0A4U1B5L2_9GAMM|nr:DUF4880 domain-containing protein [Thalassotalea mangrovi]TKB45596.1 DUF4880 domain-containing protein [Thalassotalea mangrovi]